MQEMYEKQRLLLLLDNSVAEYFAKARLTAHFTICQRVYSRILLSEALSNFLSQLESKEATVTCDEDDLGADGQLQVEDSQQGNETEETENQSTDADDETESSISTPASTPPTAEIPTTAESKREVAEYLRDIEVAEELTHKIILDLRHADFARVDLYDGKRQILIASRSFQDEASLVVCAWFEWCKRMMEIFESLRLYQKKIGTIFHPFANLPGELRREIWRLAHHQDRLPIIINLRLSMQKTDSTLIVANNMCLQNDSHRAPAVLHACRESRSQFFTQYFRNFLLKCGDWTRDRDVCVCCQDRFRRLTKSECFDIYRGGAKDCLWGPRWDVVSLSQSRDPFEIPWVSTKMRLVGVKRIVLEQELFLSLTDNELLRSEELETIFVVCGEGFSVWQFPRPPFVLSYDFIFQHYLHLYSKQLSKLVGDKKVIIVGGIPELKEILIINGGESTVAKHEERWNFK